LSKGWAWGTEGEFPNARIVGGKWWFSIYAAARFRRRPVRFALTAGVFTLDVGFVKKEK
jgi:hypothetical protein